MRQLLSVWKHRDWGIKGISQTTIVLNFFLRNTCSQKVNKNTQPENKSTKNVKGGNT